MVDCYLCHCLCSSILMVCSFNNQCSPLPLSSISMASFFNNHFPLQSPFALLVRHGPLEHSDCQLVLSNLQHVSLCISAYKNWFSQWTRQHAHVPALLRAYGVQCQVATSKSDRDLGWGHSSIITLAPLVIPGKTLSHLTTLHYIRVLFSSN